MRNAIFGLAISLGILGANIYAVMRYGPTGSKKGCGWVGWPMVGAFFAGALFEGNLNSFLYPPKSEPSVWWWLVVAALGTALALIYVREKRT